MTLKEVLLLLPLLGLCSGFLATEEDYRLIADTCYTRGALLNRDLPPNSLDAFLSIVEKLEEAERDPVKLIIMLLKKFSLQDTYYRDGFQKSVNPNGFNDDIINKALQTSIDYERFPHGALNLLNDSEKCGLYLMLSHTWDGSHMLDLPEIGQPHVPLRFPKREIKYESTPRRELPRTTTSSSLRRKAEENAITPQAVIMYGPRIHEKAKRPKEVGVIQVNPLVPEEVVDISRVLLGILIVAKYENSVINRKELYDRVGGNNPVVRKDFGDDDIDLLGVFTLGDVIARDIMLKNKTFSFDGYEKGQWLYRGCPRDYLLNNYTYGSTLAQIKGAMDGLILGKAWLEETQKIETHKLSQLLRIYYDLPPHPFLAPLGVCYRYLDYHYKKEELKRFVTDHFALQLADRSNIFVTPYLNNTPGAIESFTNDLERKLIGENLRRICGSRDIQFSDNGRSLLSGSFQPETPINLVVAAMQSLDDEQRALVAYITTHLPLQPGGSTFSLLGQGVNRVENCTSPTKAACAVLSSPEDYVNVNNGVTIIGQVREILDSLKKNSSSKYHKNGAVVIFLDYSQEVNANLKAQLKELRQENRRAIILAIGKKKEVMEQYVLNEMKNAIEHIEGTKIHILADQSILPQIRLGFAQMEVPDCQHKSDERDFRRTTKIMIRPDRSQRWELPSEFYSLSKDPVVKFSRKMGNFTICELDSIRPMTPTNCQSIPDPVKEATFTKSWPCKGFSRSWACPSFQFLVTAGRVHPGIDIRMPCTGPRCRTVYDLELEVTFENMKCCSAGLFSSLAILLFCLLSLISRQFF